MIKKKVLTFEPSLELKKDIEKFTNMKSDEKKKMVDDKYKKVYDVKSLQISLEDYEENHLKQLYDKDALMKTYFNKNFKEIQNYFSTLPKIKKS